MVRLKRYTVVECNAILPRGKVVYLHPRQDLQGFIAVSTTACGKASPFYMHPTDLAEWPYDDLDED